MIEKLITKICSNNSFLSLEVTPSLSADINQSLINELKSYDFIDAFVCTDSPLARFKPSSIISSLKLQNALSKPVICTLSMRDRNSIALCGDILGVNEFDIRLFLTLTGDPIKFGDSIESKGVFEGNSAKLSYIISELNKNRAINGKELKSKINKIYNFNVINSYSNNLFNLADRIHKKIANNDIYALFSQPIYTSESAEFLLENVEMANKIYGRDVKLVFGFFPVTSYKTAIFIKNRLKDVYIPDCYIDGLEIASSKGREYEIEKGIELSMQNLNNLKKLHNKFHFMSATKMNLVRDFFNLNIS
ncbi:MAG: methylenetetrahydrofolate reductase [Helicobacteraceae bacterium]|nr:methylenetetrahydrofolate reductase [Helicobacteraceae bacterium]